MRKVFVLGDTNLDIICDIDKIPNKGQEFNINTIKFSVGGNGANFAVALGKLGINVHLFSVIGNDFATNFLVGEIWSSGTKPDLFKSDNTNGYSVILVHKDGERRILSNKGATGELRLKMFRDDIVREIFEDDILFIPGFFHHKNLYEGLEDFLIALKERRVKVMVDLCYDKSGMWMKTLKKYIPYIDVIFLNEVELQGLTNEKGTERGIKKLFAAGLENIVLKMGPKGSAHFSLNKSFREGSVKVKCVDALAAGDVFNAGWVYGLLNGMDEKARLKIGNFVAGKKVQNHGIVVPTREEIKEFRYKK